MISSRAHILNVLILAVLVGGSILVFDTLPESIPRHAGLTGEFDAYWKTTWITWMLVPVITGFLMTMMYGVAWLIGQSLASINTPNQKTYDALPDGDKQSVVAIMQRFLYWTASATGLLLGSVHWAFYTAAVNGRDSTGSWTLPVTIVFTAGIVTLAFAAGRRMGRKADELAAGRHT